MPFWHPKGMVIWNVLEDLRRRENLQARLRRGQDAAACTTSTTWMTSGHWEKFQDDMFLVPYGEDRTLGLKPMNCPGHMLLFGNAAPQLSRAAAPLRRVVDAAPQRARRDAARPAARAARHAGRRAHLRARPSRSRTRSSACLDFAAYLYELFGMEARFELSTRPDNKLGTDEEWDFTEGALRSALERRGIEYTVNEGDGAFYGPKIDLHMTDVLGRSWQMGTIQLDSQMPARFGLTYVGEDNAEHTPYVDPSCAVRLARALHGDPDRALRRRVPGLARAGAGAGDPGRRAITARPRTRSPRSSASSASRSTTRDETVGKRIRNAEVEKIPYVVVWGDKESEDAIAVREHGGEQSTKSLDEFLAELATLLRCETCKAGATCSSPPGPRACRGFNREGWKGSGRCCAAVLSFREGGS